MTLCPTAALALALAFHKTGLVVLNVYDFDHQNRFAFKSGELWKMKTDRRLQGRGAETPALSLAAMRIAAQH